MDEIGEGFPLSSAMHLSPKPPRQEVAKRGELKPIDWEALTKWKQRREWERGERSFQPLFPDYSISDHPDPGFRLQEQGIKSLFLTTLGEISPESAARLKRIEEEYREFDRGKIEYQKKKDQRDGTRGAEMQRRDFEAQRALLSADYSLYESVQRVAEKMLQAERKVYQRSGFKLERAGLDEYDFYITKRENINAFTYRQGKAVFFEAGLLVSLEKFLQETKGYGIAEDHIAAFLGHEIAHSDPEAKLNFLNEEYCDVQGLRLTAEAGYNPWAALDVEEFLVWLEEVDQQKEQKEKALIVQLKGESLAPTSQAKEAEKKENIYIPTHPNPQHRRLIIINNLKSKEAVLANTSKEYTSIKDGVIGDLNEQMLDWQDEHQARVLPCSRADIMSQIEKAETVTELFDVLQGCHLYQKAAITQELAGNKDLVARLTLRQAITCELRASLKGKAGISFSVDDQDVDLRSVFFSPAPYFEGYKRGEALIGGLAKLRQEDSPVPELLKAAEEIGQDITGQITQEIKPKATVSSQKGGQTEADRLTSQLENLYQTLDQLNDKIDIPRLLKGDFSQHPELQKQLTELGITNFNNYLNFLQKNFGILELHPRSKPLIATRAQALFLGDQDFLQTRTEELSQAQVAQFLEQTKYCRLARFSQRAVDKNRAYKIPVLDEQVTQMLEARAKAIAGTMSAVPQERELIFRMLNAKLTQTGDDVYSLGLQLAGSTILAGRWPTVKEKFTSETLPAAVTSLRIAPAHGGFTLESLMKGGKTDNFDDFEPDLTGYREVDNSVGYLGSGFDRVKVYYHEGGVSEDDSEFFSGKCSFSLTPRTIAGQLELIAKRQTMIPTYGTEEINKVSCEGTLEILKAGELTATAEFEQLQKLAQQSNYEQERFEAVVFFEGVDTEARVQYLVDALKRGEFTFWELNKLLEFKSMFYSDEKEMALEKRKYETVMAFLRAIPSSPLPQKTLSILSYERLYGAKKRIAAFDLAREKLRRSASDGGEPPDLDRGIDFRNVDIFEGKIGRQRLEAELDFIFDFCQEGGEVAFATRDIGFYGAEQKTMAVCQAASTGVNANFMGIVRDLDYPLDILKPKVEALLAANQDRFTPEAVDKWTSFLVFCQQPEFYFRGSFTSDSSQEDKMITLKGTDGQGKQLDLTNLDSVMLLADQIAGLPECTYKDYCLRKLKEYTDGVINYRVQTRKKTEWLPHPGKDALLAKILPLFVGSFSHLGLGAEFQARKDIVSGMLDKAKQVFIPQSENFYSDPAAGLYVAYSEASHLWHDLIGTEKLMNPFNLEYRHQSKFHNIAKTELERKILYDRLRLIQDMPESGLKEALVTYSLQTACENLINLEKGRDYQDLSEEVNFLANNCLASFKSTQAKQRLWEIKLRMDLGGPEAVVDAPAIRAKFATREAFLAYLDKALLEKSVFKDPYIVLAAEAYPLKVAEAQELRTRFFTADYSTANENVALQRGMIELARNIKDNERVKKEHIRGLMMWLIDERRQVRSIDDFLVKMSESSFGRKIMTETLMWYEGETTGTPKFIWDNLVKIFSRLPLGIKRKVAAEIIKRAGGREREKELSPLLRAGMPSSLQQILLEQSFSGFAFEPTFNSLLQASGLDNPTGREIFFEMMLGKKGLMEEPVETDSAGFTARMATGFEGSAMHQFLDDILEMAFSQAKLDKSAKKVARVACHSYLEALNPIRRTIVLQNLLTEFPKVDFSEPDKEELQSKVFSVALSAMGVLGAKLGQMDEIIPKGWGSQMTSLKHATEPMSKFAVADIFRHEGCSDNYVIKENAGAASTAVGIITTNPLGEDQFVKIIRPEVKREWRQDFDGVRHMLECLHSHGSLETEAGPLIDQLERLVEEELQTRREVDNVVQYVSQETDAARRARKGVRAVKMPLARIGKEGQPVVAPADSLIIFEELLAPSEWTELSKLKADEALTRTVDLNSVHRILVKDFLYRALDLGSWHADLHDGNIMVAKDGGITRIVKPEELVYIDFGQVGSVDEDIKKANAARFLVSLGLYDTEGVAEAIYQALTPETRGTTSLTDIKRELSPIPSRLKDSVTKVIAQHEVEPYMTNFMKATVNVLPYLRALSKKEQFDLISPYIPSDIKGKLRTKLISKVVEKMGVRNR